MYSSNSKLSTVIGSNPGKGAENTFLNFLLGSPSWTFFPTYNIVFEVFWSVICFECIKGAHVDLRTSGFVFDSCLLQFFRENLLFLRIIWCMYIYGKITGENNNCLSCSAWMDVFKDGPMQNPYFLLLSFSKLQWVEYHSTLLDSNQGLRCRKWPPHPTSLFQKWTLLAALLTMTSLLE